MPFTMQTLNGFDMTKRMAASSIPAMRDRHRAFVGVYPPNPEKGVKQWRVRRFEIPEELLDTYFGEDALQDSEFIKLDDLGEVEDLLKSWGIDASSLDAPWKCDYPL